MRVPRSSLLLTLLLSIAAGTACWHRVPNHCANLAGDQTCAERGFGSYCSACVIASDGCTDERPSDECYFEGPFEATTSSEATTLELTADSSSGVTTGPQACASDEDCPEVAAPFCEPQSGECVACDGTSDGDVACAGHDSMTPLCVGGECVQCTAAQPDVCAGNTPVCDDGSNGCVACTEHEQCREAACNFYTGACLPADAVVHVGAGQSFAYIAAAVDSFGTGEEGTIVVHAGSYQDDVIVDGGRTLAFLADPGADVPIWMDLDGATNPHLRVTGEGSTAFVDSIIFSENTTSIALRITGGRAWVDRSRIVNNDGGGILVEDGAELTMRNSFVGNGTNSAVAIIVNGASAYVLYTTIGTSGNAFAISCSGAIVAIRNSLLVSRDGMGEVSCDAAMVINSASLSDIRGEGNLTLDNFADEWFVDFEAGDFHLYNPPAGLATTALWVAGDPSIDIDGDARYTAGTHGYAGADVLIP